MSQNLFPLVSEAVLNQKQIAFIRSQRVAMETNRQLSPKVLQLIYEQQWLKVMEPTICGGKAWPLPRVVQLFEKLAYTDGNVGWCINLGAGANLFSGYFPDKIARKIFEQEETWCAGSGAITGKAQKVKEGFIVNGYWKYASGSAHATHFTANCLLLDASGNAKTKNGEPTFRSFIFPKEAVTIHETWEVSGLKATSSNDFEAKDVFVPETSTFSLLQPSDFATAPLFRFPFDVMAVVNMACMATGIAIHFIECFEDLMDNKKPMHSKEKLGKQTVVSETFQHYTGKFRSQRAAMYQALEQAWQLYENDGKANPEALAALSNAAISAVQSARELIYRLFPFCGMNIIYSTSEMNQVWRDFSVASQHYLLSGLSS